MHTRLRIRLPAARIPGHTAFMEKHSVPSSQLAAGIHLSEEELRAIQELLRESGQPRLPNSQVRQIVTRLLRFYRLCETAGHAPRVSRIHSLVDKPLLPERPT